MRLSQSILFPFLAFCFLAAGQTAYGQCVDGDSESIISTDSGLADIVEETCTHDDGTYIGIYLPSLGYDQTCGAEETSCMIVKTIKAWASGFIGANRASEGNDRMEYSRLYGFEIRVETAHTIVSDDDVSHQEPSRTTGSTLSFTVPAVEHSSSYMHHFNFEMETLLGLVETRSTQFTIEHGGASRSFEVPGQYFRAIESVHAQMTAGTWPDSKHSSIE